MGENWEMNANTPGDNGTTSPASPALKGQTVSAPCILLGGAGALIAVLAELMAKGEVSAVVAMKEAVTVYLKIPAAPIDIVGLLVVFGMVLTFISQTTNYKKAFYAGASILTVLMTMVPTGLPPTPGHPGTGDQSTAMLQPPQDGEAMLVPAAFTLVQATPDSGGRLLLRLSTPDGRAPKGSDDRIVTLRAPDTKRIVAKANYTGNHLSIRHRPGDYLVEVDVPGYEPISRRVTMAAGKALNVDLALKATGRSDFLKRLLKRTR